MRILEGTTALVIGVCMAWLVGCGSAASYNDREVPRPDFPYTVVAHGLDRNTITVSIEGAAYPDTIRAVTNVDSGVSNSGSVDVDVDEDTTEIALTFVTFDGKYSKRLPKKKG